MWFIMTDSERAISSLESANVTVWVYRFLLNHLKSWTERTYETPSKWEQHHIAHTDIQTHRDIQTEWELVHIEVNSVDDWFIESIQLVHIIRRLREPITGQTPAYIIISILYTYTHIYIIMFLVTDLGNISPTWGDISDISLTSGLYWYNILI